MQVRLLYGKTGLEVTLPERNVVKCLASKPLPPLEHPSESLAALLAAPLGTPPLAQLASGKQSACIVISDLSRPVPNKLLLPPILHILETQGIAREKILILVATGLHRAATSEELLEMLGPEILARYRIESHDARDAAANVFLGTSPGGVPIWINKQYLESELKILTGLIEPHPMAGYSGGRKSICPGIAGEKTICTWHNPAFIGHEKTRFGILEGNPIHEEAVWVARAADCDFVVNAVIDARRDVFALFAGDMEEVHREGVAAVRRLVVDSVPEPVDIVVTSSAGYPLDNSWYQSIKGVLAPVAILKPGGTIILASACTQGIGNPELPELAHRFPTMEAFLEAIHNDYFIINQWQVQQLGQALAKGHVRVVTDGLPSEEIARYYVKPAPNVETAVAEALAEYGNDATIAVMSEGPYVLAELETP